MPPGRRLAEYGRLTSYLLASHAATVTLSWAELDQLVGGLPPSAVNHFPQWWHGDRPNTRAWRRAGYRLERVRPGHSVTFRREADPTPASAPAGPGRSGAPSSRPLTRVDSSLDVLGRVNP